MIEDQTKVIDGLSVRVSQHPARKAARLLAKVGRTIGPAIGALRGMSADDLKKDVADLTPILSALFARLEDDVVDGLITDLLSCTSVTDVDGNVHQLATASKIDHVFTGRLRSLISACAFALEVNFKGFFVESGRGSP